jgi:hypothetical protein
MSRATITPPTISPYRTAFGTWIPRARPHLMMVNGRWLATVAHGRRVTENVAASPSAAFAGLSEQ